MLDAGRKGPQSMTALLRTRRFALPALVILGATTTARPDGDGDRDRALAAARLTFREYVFTGEPFPPCDFEQPDRVKDLVGPYSIKPTFYGRDFRPAETAASPGLYGAVVEVTSEAGVTLRRDVTLFRTPARVDPGWHFDAAAPDEAARRLGLDAARVRRHADVLAGEFRGRAFADLAHDPRVARLLAGLSLAKDGDGPVHPGDADTPERRWWADLKRRLSGPDRGVPKPDGQRTK
jgi:hypothetical protein